MIRPNFFYLVSPFTLLHLGLKTLSMSGCNKCTILQLHEMRQRRICTTSHYKMTCECCGKTINRGDKITQVLGSEGRMRARHAPCASLRAIADAEDGCYSKYAYAPTRNKWVHLHCRPQYFQDWGNGSIGYFPHPTAYSHDIEQRLSAAAFDPDWGEDLMDIPHPVWKWESERLAKAIIPVQRWWKKTRKRLDKHRIGTNTPFLFDRGKTTEALYSGEIQKIHRSPRDGVMVGVYFHYDGEKRWYHWKKYIYLVKECADFMQKIGIHASFTGKISTHHRHRFHNNRG